MAAYRNGGLDGNTCLAEKKAPGAAPKIQGEVLEKLPVNGWPPKRAIKTAMVPLLSGAEAGVWVRPQVRYGQSLCEPEVKG